MNVAPYRKFVVAVCGAVSIAVADGLFDTNDVIVVALAGLSALGVYKVPNDTRPPLD